mgnify:FL=1
MAKLVYERTGIHLPETKSTMLSNRLRKRLRELKIESYDAYYELLKDPARCEEELPNFLSAVTTNETYFFRNEALWKFFEDQWIPDMVERRKNSPSKTLALWSAASSSGEEAYTAAICLRERLPAVAAWKINIVGTDISEKVLARARSGCYNDYAVSRMPAERREKWFNAEDGSYVLKPSVRDMVSFRSHNLRDPFTAGKFDLVFLRNVLMYFDTPMKLRVLQNVTAALAPGGKLFVGDVDPIRNTRELNAALTLNYAGPNLYEKPERTAVAAGAGNRK